MKNVKRLFASFQPEHYEINLVPDRDAMTFSGIIVINGKKSGRPSKRLTFHQKGLKITTASVVSHGKKGDQELTVERINTQKSFDEVRLHFKDNVYPGSFTVKLEFSGKISTQMEGVYPCNFTLGGKPKKLIATQFESHHAREVFPCIDEPEAKATFQLSLTTPADETVISNTPVRRVESRKSKVESSDSTDLVKTTFEPTPIMSTYLFAFVYGEMGFLEAETKTGVKVRTYATPDNVKLSQFALDFAVKCLEFYNDYFGIDYPLAKCDLVALPDFAAGAMENWGCITFREQAMLVDDANTSLSSKQYVAMVVAHELAHMWFGNLVTMRWWTDLWLNEGFASWIEYLAVDHIYPDWKMWTQFIIDEQQQAMKLDALEHTHPIEVHVSHPDEIRSIFDAISYNKGASSIHMLYLYLGPEDFRTGLQYYLKKHSYGNIDTVDLWDALEEASKKPVKEFMNAWTSQPGFPLLSAVVTDDKVELTQQRFFVNPKHTLVAETNWPIALVSEHKDLPELMIEKSIVIETRDTHRLKLNNGQGGFYRVAYNSTQVAKLGELVKRGKLSAIDRLGVLTDMFEASKAGHVATIDSLHFLENFAAEDDYAVWDSIAIIVGSIRLIMDTAELRELMKPFIRRLVAKQLARLGWHKKEGDSHFDLLLRPIILGMAASADEPEIVQKCLSLFESIQHTSDVSPDLKEVSSARNVRRGSDIDPDLRGVVYGTAARLGGVKEFDKMLRLHNETTLSEEKVTLTAAMTGFKQPEVIKKALALIDTKDVRHQDVGYWIAYSFVNRYARDLTWEWLKTHWDWLDHNLGGDLSFYRMPVYVARAINDAKFLPQFTKFFEPRLSPAIQRSYDQGVEMIQWQSAWLTRDQKSIKAFFKARG